MFNRLCLEPIFLWKNQIELIFNGKLLINYRFYRFMTKSLRKPRLMQNLDFHYIGPTALTAVHQPLAKYYQLLGLHVRRWHKWQKIGV